MTEKYLFDTSWIINAFQKQSADSQKLILDLSLNAEIAISAISITEIRVGLKGKQIGYTLPKIQSAFKLEPVNYEIAEKAGELLGKYRDNGISLGDTIIAATAVVNEYTLITNDRDFSVLKELTCYKIK